MGREVLQPHGTGMALVFLSEHLKKVLNLKYFVQALPNMKWMCFVRWGCS